MQVKLLRLLETGTHRRVGSTELRHTDVRVVAATHRDLPRMVAEGRFREDLYYRLCVFPIALPPLRERASDIRLLAPALLQRVAPHRPLHLSPAALALLQTQAFPGNVRELRNLLERSALLCDGPTIERSHVQAAIDTGAIAHRPGALAQSVRGPVAEQADQALRQHIARHQGSRSQLAAELGMSERTLYRKIKALGISTQA
jgi:DNA-binding NtrC family response regulator